MNSFGNIITQVVTQSNDPKFFVGQVFHGYFQYDSGATGGADGVFHIANTTLTSENPTLKGTIYLPFPEGIARQNSLPDTMNDGYVKVEGGVVTDFVWSIQTGDFYAGFSKGLFYARLLNRYDPKTGTPLPDIETNGTVVFGVPLRQS